MRYRTRCDSRLLRTVGVVAVLALAAGCSDDGTTEAAGDPPAGGSSSAAVLSPTPGTTEAAGDPPAGGDQALADGRYRVAVTEAEVSSAGLNNSDGWTGTWTLDLADGTYQLTCKPLDLPGKDCGNTVSDKVLEAGALTIEGDTAALDYDPELMSRLTGCALPVSSTDPSHCYPLEPYRFTWSVDGDELTFRDAGSSFVPHSFLLKPWQRIA